MIASLLGLSFHQQEYAQHSVLTLFLQCAVFVSWPCTSQIGKFLLLLATLLFVLVFKATKCLRLFLRTWRTFHAYVLENVAWHVGAYVSYTVSTMLSSWGTHAVLRCVCK